MTTLAPESLWMEIVIDCLGNDIRVSGRTCLGPVSAPRSLGPDMTVERVQAFGKRVAEAASSAPPPDALVNEARTIRRAVMDGRLDQMRSELHGAAGPSPVLVRFLITSTALQSVPWEALCDADEDSKPWGTSLSYLIARGVRDPEPARIHRVPSALNVLVVAPLGGGAIERVQRALSERIAANEVIWLAPIDAEHAQLEYLFDRLGKEPVPHILHFVGHGGLHDGKPALQLAGGTEDAPAWIDVEDLAMQLRSAGKDSVRLVVLEACEGASPGELSSAAEALCRQGAHAVVAHLWPVEADLARQCSERFYSAFTGSGPRRGDAAGALNYARRALFALNNHTAQAVSPVLYLRGNDARLFEFTEEIAPSPQTADDLAKRKILEKVVGNGRPFTLILGDGWPHDREAFEGFKNEIRAKFPEPRRSELLPPGLPSSAIMERAALEIGHSHLETKFQQVFKPVKPPGFIEAIAPFVAGGPHISLLRAPLLEQAVEKASPDKTLYVVQPGHDGTIVYCRKAHASEWEDLAELPDTFDPDNDILIFRLYSGYTPVQLFAALEVTEDDFQFNVGGIAEALYGRGHRGDAADTVISVLTQRPALIMGLSILAWHHRKVLHDIFEGKKLPGDSLAIIADDEDRSFWTGDRAGRRIRTGLPGDSTVAAISGTTDALMRWLGAIATENQIRVG
ncbi:MAG TPA: CHAT domain-containing protein [Kofleriaceae bacterium]|nr:CHAT domain-containing protein [Kofleriaceae bacterium]